MRALVHAAVLAGAVILSSNCNNSSTPTKPSATPSTFAGTFAAVQGQNGTLTVTVQGALLAASRPFKLPLVATLHAQSTNATGVLNLVGGGTASLSGNYNAGSKVLSLSGAGYSVSGTLGSGTIAGTLTVPAGATGAFTTVNTSSGSVALYCGQQVTPSGEKVVFNVAVSSSTGDMNGSFAVTPSGAGTLTGKQTGTNFTTTYVTTVGPFKGDTGVSSGTIVNGVLNGVDKSGAPFSASIAQCPATQ